MRKCGRFFCPEVMEKVAKFHACRRHHLASSMMEKVHYNDVFEWILDIFSKIGRFGCSNSIDIFVNTLLINWHFMGDMWILSDYFNVKLIKYDGNNKKSIYWCQICINQWWIIKYNQNNCYDIIIINYAYSIGRS